MEYKTLSFSEFKAVDETGTFEGSLAVYGNIDEGGDVIDHGAFTKTLKESGGIIPLLYQHDTKLPIGRLELIDTPTALHAKGKLLLKVPQAAIAYELMKEGVLKGLSIGYKTIKQLPGDGARRLKELRLYEGSLVTFGMNPLALVSAVKEAEPADMEAIEAFRNASRDLKQFYSNMLN